MVWKNCPSLHHHQQGLFPCISQDNSQECSLNIPGLNSIFINLNFSRFYIPDLWKKVLPEPFHLSLNDEPLFILTAAHKHCRQVFSSVLSTTHHPSSNCQFRFIYTKLSADTISRSLNLWEGLGSAWVFKLSTRVQPHFFVLPVLGFDSRQYHERWLSEDESVGGSRGWGSFW